MKVYYINKELNTVISLDKLNKLSPNTRLVMDHKGREIAYRVNDIYKCREWKVCTIDDNSLNLDDIRNLMEKVEKDSELYNKLRKEEETLLNIFVEEISLELERSLF